MEEKKENIREEIFSRKVRAGRRTYFFDVRATRGNDYYLTITESKRMRRDDESFYYEKHKIFLYGEDFDNFLEVLDETLDYIKTELLPEKPTRRVQYIPENDSERKSKNETKDEGKSKDKSNDSSDELKWD